MPRRSPSPSAAPKQETVAHPVRARVLDAFRASDEPLSPVRLADLTGTSLGTVSYHVRTLRGFGLIEIAKQVPRRGAIEHYYRLTEAGRNAPDEQRLEALMQLCGALHQPNPDGKGLIATILDEDAKTMLTAIIDRITPEVQALAAASTFDATRDCAA